MIIVRCPLRISLGGGATDLSSYYSKREGFVIAGAINKYIYIAIHKTFEKNIIAKYSSLERVSEIQELKHPIIKSVLEVHGKDLEKLEITSFADIPGGTGLGSSSAFTNALIKGINNLSLDQIANEDLAKYSCNIEIDILKEPIGKQDQYITALGGIREFTFKKNGKVDHSLVYKNEDDYLELSSRLVLVFTGVTRKASNILNDQKVKSEIEDEEMLNNLDETKRLGKEASKMIKNKDFNKFGELLDAHWQNKKNRSDGMSSKKIEEIYELGMSNGANGGKVIGAGGGGFILFQTENKAALTDYLRNNNLRVVDFNFVSNGCEIINF